MATKHKVTATLPTSGAVQPGLVITLKWGSDCINGRTPGGTVGTYTESPASSGAYEVTITETNSYTVEVNGTVQSELQDVWLVAGDILTAPTLASTSSGKGASLIGIYDSANLYTATTVEAALAEIAGAGRTTAMTVKSAYNLANSHETKLSGIDNPMLVDLTDGGDSTAHTHDTRYFTEAELSSTGVSALRITSGGTLLAVGGTTGALTVGSCADSGGDMGDLTLDAHTASAGRDGGDIFLDVRAGSGGTQGNAYIKRAEGDYSLITEFEIGDLDLSSSHYLRNIDPADDGFLTNALRELDTRLALLSSEVQGGASVFKVAWTNPKLTAVGAVGGDIAALTYWTVATGNDFDFARITLPVTEAPMARIRIWFTAKMSAGTGKLTATMGAVTATVATTATGDTALYIDLVPNVSYSSPVSIVLTGNAIGGTLSIREDICIGYY